MKMRKRGNRSVVNLSPLDAGWLWLESDANLMHGSVLAIFQEPPGAPPDFVLGIVERMRAATVVRNPFDLRLRRKGFGRIWPQWERVETIDPMYHIRHSALARSGADRELEFFVSHLHSVRLDKAHPLWTFDIIEGLGDHRFAVLGKMHHALVDGVGALRLFQHWLSTDPAACEVAPMWVAGAPPRKRPSEIQRSPKGLARSAGALRNNLTGLRFACTGVAARPWGAPPTVLNRPITAHRLIATESYRLGRFRALADAICGTINDVVLAVCAGGLRRYLTAIGELPNTALTTNIPVSVHKRGLGRAAGNAISWAMVPLPTHEHEPRERARAVVEATAKAKRRLEGIAGSAINTYTLGVTTPILFEQVLGLGGRIKPYYNVPISNVPGPRKPLYLDGASLVDIHASTVIYQGQALNIVCLSYADKLEFTFTACSTALPQVQRIAVHCGAELELLESVYGTTDPVVAAAV
ncbi:wax ester/triacylglycerol synthase family O-acyltransferase [Nocardia vinacea]|uniref:wax ester/triacylglycerol synthase family O-acyltransferase n=1 Tax=Nocardia vinacea TaxID=96468 RepID=UPI00342B17FB